MRSPASSALDAGTDLVEASRLALVRDDLRVVDAIRLVRRTLATMTGNLFWVFAHEVAAIPLAVAALLTPLIAGTAMAFSSVFVASNSLRLRRFHADSIDARGDGQPRGTQSPAPQQAAA